MNVLVVYAHPNPESFVASLRTAAIDSLRAAGHDVRQIDLYADGFDARLPESERRGHRDPAAVRPALDGYAADLRWARAIVFVYPTWWSAQPAILKGWFDRVWTSGIAYELSPAGGRPSPLLRHIDRIVAVTTHGSPKRINALEGEAGKRTLFRSLRSQCSRRTRTRWIAMYNLDRATADQRAAFVERVRRVCSRL